MRAAPLDCRQNHFAVPLQSGGVHRLVYIVSCVLRVVGLSLYVHECNSGGIGHVTAGAAVTLTSAAVMEILHALH